MDEQIVTVATLLAESLNQLSFVCALIGGFSIALIAGQLAMEKNRIAKFSALLMSIVAISQIGFTIFLSLSAFRIYTYTANRKLDLLEALINNFDKTLKPFVFTFFSSIILFFIGIAVSGFLFGKKVGIVVSISSGLLFLLLLFGLSILNG
jgi:hypothetical protein